jgi:hypothetical protein
MRKHKIRIKTTAIRSRRESTKFAFSKNTENNTSNTNQIGIQSIQHKQLIRG